MYIRDLLALNLIDQTELSQPAILGDAYLLKHNPLYRAIKRGALEIGATFTEAWPEYLLFPFHQLNMIVTTKTIPFVPSGRILRDIEAKRPDTLTTDDLPIPESYHLHEASHVIAEEYSKDHPLKTQSEKILKALVCESFANSVDALACAHVADEEHRFLLKQNNYMQPNQKYADAILRLRQVAGPRFTFFFTLITYLHANFLHEETAANLVKKVSRRFAPEVKLSAKSVKDCEVLRKMADNLDPQFRMLTTKTYLNLEGHFGEVEDLLAFDFMEVFDANPGFAKIVSAMAELCEA